MHNIITIIGDLITGAVTWITQYVLDGMFSIYESTFRLTLRPDSSIFNYPLSGLGNVFRAVALILAAISFLYQLFAVITAPVTGNDRISPVQILLRYILSMLLISASLPVSDLILQMAQAVADGPFASALSSLPSSYNAVSISFSGWANILWEMILVSVLAYNVFMAALNQVQRYIVLYIEYYLAPIAMSFTADPRKSDSAKEFFVSYGLGTVVIMANRLLMGLAMYGLNSYNGQPFDLLGFMIILALVSTAHNSERLLSRLGIHSMPTMDSARNFMAGLHVASMASRTAVQTAGLAAGAVRTGIGLATSSSSVSQTGGKIPAGSLASSIRSRAADAVQKRYAPKAAADGTLQTPSALKAMSARVLGTQIGATAAGRRKGAVSNLYGYAMTRSGMNAGRKAIGQAVDAYNGFVASKGKGSLLTAGQAAAALGLSGSMPYFRFNPSSPVSYDAKTNGIRMHGWEMDSRGREHSVSYAFGTSESAPVSGGGVKYGSDAIQLGESGQQGIHAYRIAETGDMSSIFRQTSDSYGYSSPRSGWVSPAELTSVINPQETMDHFRISSASISDDGYLTVNGTRTHADGSSSAHTYLVAADEIQAGEIIGDTGGMADTSKFYDLGNGYTAYPLHKAPDRMTDEEQKLDWEAVIHPVQTDRKEDIRERSRKMSELPDDGYDELVNDDE